MSFEFAAVLAAKAAVAFGQELSFAALGVAVSVRGAVNLTQSDDFDATLDFQ